MNKVLSDEEGLKLSSGEVPNLGPISATTGTFSGAVSATTGTFTGAVSGTSGTFTAALSGTSVIGTGLGSFAGVINTGTIINNGTTASSGAGAVLITGSIHEITTTGTGDALTLADGAEGQELYIVYVAEGAGADTAILTPTNFGNGSTITFNAVGDNCTLKFTNSTWYVKSLYLAAVA